MQILSIQIKNYKSFLDSGLIEFDPKFSVVVGENNSGKTALLEALSLRFANIPHLSEITAPRRVVSVPSGSLVEVRFQLDWEELLEILTENFGKFSVPIVYENHKDEAASLFLNWVNKDGTLTCSLSGGNITNAKFPYETKIYNRDKVPVASFVMERGKPVFRREQNSSAQLTELLPRKLAEILVQRVYAFRAERLFVGQCKFGNNSKLNPDASNLPEVLAGLQGKYLIDEFNRLVRQVFPKIHRVSARPHESDSTLVKIYINTNHSRDDLALPLQDSGTGIGQVLAILYVVLTAQFPQTIIIDEPQSFLHPNAIRRLFDVLKQYPNHQYIISTHSPIVISASDPGMLISIQKNGNESEIQAVDRTQRRQVENVLRNLGTRLSDVFGADNILWVEGETEEKCFPLILSGVVNIPLLGTAIVGVLNTGDFEGKYSERVFRIYEKLSSGNDLLPPAIGFVFDSENKSESEKEDLRKRSRDEENGQESVFFLARRMYENYLLDSEAIASVISELREKPLESKTVDKWIEKEKWEREYFGHSLPRREENRTEAIWLEKVHGSKLLNSIFREFLTGIDYESNKLEYSQSLTKWLIRNKPDALSEVAELLRLALNRKSQG